MNVYCLLSVIIIVNANLIEIGRISQTFYPLVQTIPSTKKEPLIFFDRKHLYHATVSLGCEYICNFTKNLEGLGKGDVAVFSVGFNVSLVKDLHRKGVLIAFESWESPVNMPSLSTDQLEQVNQIISSFALVGNTWIVVL